MTKPILHARPPSSNAVQPLLSAADRELDLDLEVLQPGSPEDRAALAAVNPNGKIPVLGEDDVTSWASNAINECFGEQCSPGQTRLPSVLRAKDEVHRWVYWITAHFGAATGGLSFERFVKCLTGRGEAEPQPGAAHEADFHQFARVIDSHVAHREYFANGAPRLADYSFAAVLIHTENAMYPIASYRHLVAHRTAIRGLPAWKKVFP